MKRLDIGVHRPSLRPHIYYDDPDWQERESGTDSPDGPSGWAEISEVERAQKLRSRERVLAGKLKTDQVIAVDMLRGTGLPRPTVLGVGCGVGLYEAVFTSSDFEVDYFGCDVARGMIQQARQSSPHPGRWCVQDACDLGFDDESFDVVVLEGCVECVPAPARAIGEAARVAREYVLVHRACIFHNAPTKSFDRRFRGSTVPMTVFNERELVEILGAHWLRIAGVDTASSRHVADGRFMYLKSYLCKLERR